MNHPSTITLAMTLILIAVIDQSTPVTVCKTTVLVYALKFKRTKTDKITADLTERLAKHIFENLKEGKH